MNNQFGKLSKLQLKTENREGNTILSHVEFTAPFKIMKPFPQRDGSLLVMPMLASPGLMEGDEQFIEIDVGEDSHLQFTNQSFEKVHKMQQGFAKRNATLTVGRNAELFYNPLPIIPFAQSVFCGNTIVKLEDKSSRLSYRELISCGRVGMGEEFCFRSYKNKVEIYQGNELLYYDNTMYEPALMRMKEIGFFEGYTHMLTWITVNMSYASEKIRQIRQLLNCCETVAGGATLTEHGDCVIKILGRQANILLELCEEIEKIDNGG